MTHMTDTDVSSDPTGEESSKENCQSPTLGGGILKYKSRSQGIVTLLYWMKKHGKIWKTVEVRFTSILLSP